MSNYLLFATTATPATIGLLDGGIWEIIRHTTFFGMVILIILVGLSLVSWSIIISKYRRLKAERTESQNLLLQFRRNKRLADSVNLPKQYPVSILGLILDSGVKELVALRETRESQGNSVDSHISNSEIEELDVALENANMEGIRSLEAGVSLLATTANAAPFLGLLGTVVGIMVSFWEIGRSGSASLAVVAPGIAEALLATIVGLAAAIPAVIAYNWANSRLRIVSEDAAAFVDEFLMRIKKEFGA